MVDTVKQRGLNDIPLLRPPIQGHIPPWPQVNMGRETPMIALLATVIPYKQPSQKVCVGVSTKMQYRVQNNSEYTKQLVCTATFLGWSLSKVLTLISPPKIHIHAFLHTYVHRNTVTIYSNQRKGPMHRILCTSTVHEVP